MEITFCNGSIRLTESRQQSNFGKQEHNKTRDVRDSGSIIALYAKQAQQTPGATPNSCNVISTWRRLVIGSGTV